MATITPIVNVTISVSPTFPQREGFGILNIIGSSLALPIGERLRFYASLVEVGIDHAASSEEYKAARIAFSQVPQPSRIAISRRYAAAVAAELLGGPVSASIATYTGITTGAFAITTDGTVKQVVTINLTGAASMNAIAALIQTRVQAVATGATVVWLGNRFKVTSGTTGATSSISFASAPASGTDISAILGLDAASGGKTTQGAAVESITDSLNNLQLFNSAWYGFALTDEANEAQKLEASAWAEASVKVHGLSTRAANNKDASSTASIGYQLKTLLYRRTLAFYDANDAYPAVSALARGLSVDYTAPDSAITLKFKTLPGITVDSLTETERLALVGNFVNYYTTFGTAAMVAEGVMSSGVFFDEVTGLDALKVEIEDRVFAKLYSNPTKVPQTDKGVAQIVQAVEGAFSQFVTNGFLAPAQWNGADLGQIENGDFLPKGYYVFAAPVASQSQVQRAARIAPPISAIACGAGALHSVNIGVNFQR